jgi:hypothetical protein
MGPGGLPLWGSKKLHLRSVGASRLAPLGVGPQLHAFGVTALGKQNLAIANLLLAHGARRPTALGK